MSQREAAAHLGIAVGSLARYEAGERRTPMTVLRRMAGVYGRPVSELLEHGGCAILPLPRGIRWRPEDVPAAITALRVAAGLTKVGLGRLTGRSGQAVAGWEAGRTRPAPATCRRLETIFGLPAGRLPY
jgi:transcriptional regulator with XRE-family HTH domain